MSRHITLSTVWVRAVFNAALTDTFLELPASAQLLYFHLSARVDGKGCVAEPRAVMNRCGANNSDMKKLIANRFVLLYGSGIKIAEPEQEAQPKQTDEEIYNELCEKYGKEFVDSRARRARTMEVCREWCEKDFKPQYTKAACKVKAAPEPADIEYLKSVLEQVRSGKDEQKGN